MRQAGGRQQCWSAKAQAEPAVAASATSQAATSNSNNIKVGAMVATCLSCLCVLCLCVLPCCLDADCIHAQPHNKQGFSPRCFVTTKTYCLHSSCCRVLCRLPFAPTLLLARHPQSQQAGHWGQHRLNTSNSNSHQQYQQGGYNSCSLTGTALAHVHCCVMPCPMCLSGCLVLLACILPNKVDVQCMGFVCF